MGPSTTQRGALIVLEGLDRAGKTTQHARLCSHLQTRGHEVSQMRFPDRTTPVGRSISSYLQGESQLDNHAIHLLFSANRWEAAGTITDLIANGTSVVIDRYYYSGIVYSVAKERSDLTMEWARAPDIGLPKPDVILFMDLDPTVAAQRGGFGEEKYETVQMQVKVRRVFHGLFANAKEMTNVIDASRGVDEVADDIAQTIDGLFARQDWLARPLGMVQS